MTMTNNDIAFFQANINVGPMKNETAASEFAARSTELGEVKQSSVSVK
jgi:hypothetical protein